MALAGAVNVVAAFTVAFCVPSMLDAIGSNMGWIFSGISIIATCYAYFRVLEIRGRSLEELGEESRTGVPQAVYQRLRSNRACERCRGKKLRCATGVDGPGCHQCQKAGVRCSFSIVPSQSGQNGAPSGFKPASYDDDKELVPRKQLLSILDAYFDGPHYFSFSTFIHRPSFMKMLENNLIPRSLLLVVLATGLRYVDQESTSPDRWADECRNLGVLYVFSSISTTNLLALLLLQKYEWHRGAHLSTWFLSGLVFRLAHALQLHLEPSEMRV
ncbi:Fc.00g104020.m01.CDS01 [Cosmosporella sp. VM-42]